MAENAEDHTLQKTLRTGIAENADRHCHCSPQRIRLCRKRRQLWPSEKRSYGHQKTQTAMAIRERERERESMCIDDYLHKRKK